MINIFLKKTFKKNIKNYFQIYLEVGNKKWLDIVWYSLFPVQKEYGRKLEEIVQDWEL